MAKVKDPENVSLYEIGKIPSTGIAERILKESKDWVQYISKDIFVIGNRSLVLPIVGEKRESYCMKV